MYLINLTNYLENGSWKMNCKNEEYILVSQKYFWPNPEIVIFCFEIQIPNYDNSDLEGLKKVCNFKKINWY